MRVETIYVRVPRSKVRETIFSIPRKVQTRGQIQDKMFTECSEGLLAKISQAFEEKSQGRTDDAGQRWAPLSPKTLANRRARLKRRQKQALRWLEIYHEGIQLFHGDTKSAARRAWMILKKEGIETTFDKYAYTHIDILHDTGRLLHSLIPNSHSADQILRLETGAAVIGTSRKHAGTHHKGTRRIPQRRLWPEVRRWPNSWWYSIQKPAVNGIVDLIMDSLKHATS